MRPSAAARTESRLGTANCSAQCLGSRAPLAEINGQKTARNAVIVSPGRIGRSPSGTGTCARRAIMYAKNQLKIGERFIHESIIRTKFSGEVLSTAAVGGVAGVNCAI